jgi:3-oxoacyl-[acyl-carrier protein] reductase
MSFMDKQAVVTGAAGGMGYAISAALLAQGCNVVMLDCKQAPVLPKGKGNPVYYQGDICDQSYVNKVFSSFDKLDYLVNVAGILNFSKDKGAVDMDLEFWDQVMSVNLKSMVITLKAAVPMMQKNTAAAIVNFSTIQCLRGDHFPQDAYQASKAGVIALTKSIAVQYAKDNIRANTILPGPTASPMQNRWVENPSQRYATEKAIPLGRVGKVEDMSAACLFLLSSQASFITGTDLVIDGGLMALP